MHPSFLNILADPYSKESLKLEIASTEKGNIKTGFLISPTNIYPIINFIPRFIELDINYTHSFSYQWNKWQLIQHESNNRGKIMEGHTKKMFEKIIGMENINFENQIILDVGCGTGRFIELAVNSGAKIIGLGLSNSVEVAQKNTRDNENALIIQADALHLPIHNNILDGIYSIGVLHHTPDPLKGVFEIYNSLKNNGWFSLHVYGKGGYYDKPIVNIYRKIFKILQPLFKQYPPLIYSYIVNILFRKIDCIFPIIGKIIKTIFPFINLPDFKWSVLDTFDSVTPTYQSTHTSFEVFSWFKRAGFLKIEPTDWGFTSFRGIK